MLKLNSLSITTVKEIRQRKLPAIILCLCALALLSAACTSTPVARHPPEDEHIKEVYYLPAGGSVYLWADLALARPLVENLLADRNVADAAQVFEFTKAAALALFLEGQRGDGEMDVFLAATGRFPLQRANFALATSRGWEQRKGESGAKYWHSPSSNISITLSSRLLLASSSSLETPRTITPPEAFGSFSAPLAISGWIPNAASLINSFAESSSLPIQIPATELFFGAARLPQSTAAAGRRTAPAIEEEWEFVLRIITPSANDARSLASLFAMARLFLQQDGDTDNVITLLLANAPEQSGNALTLRTPPIKRSKIPLLFDQF